MLIRIDRFEALDGAKLMELYAESNAENAEYFYPDLKKEDAERRVAQEFLAFLRDEFFRKPENTYWVWEQDDVYLSALRLTELPDRLFYLEALETHPAHRRKGCATALLQAVIETLKRSGPFRICDCVSKHNTESIRTHLRAGFRIVSETGYDYLQGESDNRDYGFAYIDTEK